MLNDYNPFKKFFERKRYNPNFDSELDIIWKAKSFNQVLDEPEEGTSGKFENQTLMEAIGRVDRMVELIDKSMPDAEPQEEDENDDKG